MRKLPLTWEMVSPDGSRTHISRPWNIADLTRAVFTIQTTGSCEAVDCRPQNEANQIINTNLWQAHQSMHSDGVALTPNPAN